MNQLFRSLLTVVGVPTLLAAIYFGLFATDVYVSEGSFAIRSSTSSAQSSGLSSLLSSSIVSSGTQDSLLIAEYVQSHDMLAELQKRIDIRGHYSDEAVDRLSRMKSDATLEEMREFFREHVRIMRDSQSDVLTLFVRAFDPVVSHDIAEAIIDISESLINRISDNMESDALASANAEVDIAMKKVHMASAALTRFRSSNVSMNPIMEAEALFGVVTGLEQSITEVEAQLVEKRAYMRDGSPEVTALRNRLNALKKQRSVEKGRLLGGDGSKSPSLIGDYEPLEVARELAQQQYASALASLELARVEVARKKLYLGNVHRAGSSGRGSRAKTSDECPHGQRIFSFVIYLIGGLMWSALKDHIGK